MSILRTLRAFQSVNRSVQGIKRAPDPKRLPRALADDDLPIAIALPSLGEWFTRSSGFSQQFRTVLIRVYVKPAVQGEDASTHLELTARLIQAMVEALLDDVTLGGEVQHIGTGGGVPTVTDSGIMALEYAGALYVGFELTVTIKENV